MTDLRAAVERLLWTTMDHDGERFTLPADSDGRFAPAENLRELATLLSQPEPSSPEKVVERVFMEMWIRLPLDLKARVMQHGFSLDPILLALRGSGEIGRDG
jgi:hypothetical protein